MGFRESNHNVPVRGTNTYINRDNVRRGELAELYLDTMLFQRTLTLLYCERTKDQPRPAPSPCLEQSAAGSNSSLTGWDPVLVVEEMQSGRPSYTASYEPVGTGPYQVAVTQLLPGGLSATYWDNEWLLDAPAVQRVDAEVGT